MPFLLLLTLGAFALFMTTAGNTIAIMRSVPREHRPFALALATLGAHLFGDVPSPIVLGALEDALAPKCVPEYDDDGDDGGFSIGPECASQRAKLRFTWLLCVLWPRARWMWTALLNTRTRGCRRDRGRARSGFAKTPTTSSPPRGAAPALSSG